jgi:hypothetical protein
MHVALTLISSFIKSRAENEGRCGFLSHFFKKLFSLPKALSNNEMCQNKSLIDNNRNFTTTNSKSGLTDTIPLDAATVPM